MNHKIRITTPYPTTEEVIRVLEMTPADIKYVDQLLKKHASRKSATARPSPSPSRRETASR